jgi:hypothetical protein
VAVANINSVRIAEDDPSFFCVWFINAFLFFLEFSSGY